MAFSEGNPEAQISMPSKKSRLLVSKAEILSSQPHFTE